MPKIVSSCPYPFIFSLNRIVLKIFLGIRKLGDVKGEVDFVKISLFLSLVLSSFLLSCLQLVFSLLSSDWVTSTWMQPSVHLLPACTWALRIIKKRPSTMKSWSLTPSEPLVMPRCLATFPQ